MKIYTPPKELVELDLVLKFNSEMQNIFSGSEKRAINFKRARLMAGTTSSLEAQLQTKIQFTLNRIEKLNWQPNEPILYSEK